METSEDIEGSLDDLLKQELTDYQGDFQKTCKFIKIFSESCIALTNNIYNRILHAIEDDGGLFFKDELIKIKPTEISVYNLLYLKETFYETEIIFELQVGEEYYKCRYYDDQSMTNFNNALKFKETPWKQIKIEIIEKLQSGEKMDFDINNLTDEEKQTIIEFIEEKVDIVATERVSWQSLASFSEGKLIVDQNTEICSEFVESTFENYWCDFCEKWVGEEDGDEDRKCTVDDLLKHVILHLKSKGEKIE